MPGIPASTDSSYTIDLATRQQEINQQSYQNKRETLFFLQLLFLALAFLSILMQFRSTGVIPMIFVIQVGIILALGLSLVFINMMMYTSNRRDPRYWHRQWFLDDNRKASPIPWPPITPPGPGPRPGPRPGPQPPGCNCPTPTTGNANPSAPSSTLFSIGVTI